MQMTIEKQIGKKVYKFTVEGKNLHELGMQAENLSFPDVHECGLCKDQNIYLKAYVTEGKEKYNYVKIACAKCRGSLTFGQKKGSEVFFLRKKENSKEYDWQAFVPKTEEK